MAFWQICAFSFLLSWAVFELTACARWNLPVKIHPQNTLGWSQTCHATLRFFFLIIKHSSACCHVIWHDGCNDDGGSCHYQAERMLRLECERLQLSCNGEAPTTEETSKPNLLFFWLGHQATDQEDTLGTKVDSTWDSKSMISRATRGQTYCFFSASNKMSNCSAENLNRTQAEHVNKA